MKIILKEDVQNLGQPGDIVMVKDGFARNYLLPRKLALAATAQNMKIYEQERKRVEAKRLQDKADAEAFAAKLKNVSLTVAVAVGEEDKVFGSVTAQNIADLLQSNGIEIDRRRILLNEPIKALGVYEIPIKVHSEVEAAVKLWVVKE